MSHHQNGGQKYDINIAIGSFENVAKLRYLERQKQIQTTLEQKLREYLVFLSAI